jgi:multicomponent Na+:H+ antiporter subunit D
VLTRASASTKAAGLGVALVLGGAAFLFGTAEAAVKLSIAVAVQFATAPVSGHVIGRAAYRSGAPLWEGTHTDQLGDHYAAREAAAGDRDAPPAPRRTDPPRGAHPTGAPPARRDRTGGRLRRLTPAVPSGPVDRVSDRPRRGASATFPGPWRTGRPGWTRRAMATQASWLPLLAVALPMVTAAVIVAARHRPTLRDGSLVAGAVVTFAVLAALLPPVLAGQVPTTTLVEVMPGVALALRADGMGMVFAALAGFLWVLASPYAVGYLRGEGAKNRTRFNAFYALCLSTAFGVAFAADLFTFFVFYELLTIATYPLVTHKGDAVAVAAGRRYLAYLISGGAAVLVAFAIVYAQTGEASFVPGGFVGDGMSTGLALVTFGLFAIGFGTKAGVMPLHAWLPAAMVAPTPVSALLHAVAVVKAGVFAFGRLVGFVFGPETLTAIGGATILAGFAAATIVIASVIALRQDHLKRRLAYSTIAHLAYIVLGFAVLSEAGFTGSLLHIVNHGALKITLFFAAGALHVHLHLDRVSELDGVGRRMPLTMGAFALASLGLAGLPPMGGFVSKWYLVLGAYQAEQYLYAAVMAAGGIFTAGYLFPVVYRAFFRPLPARDHTGGDDGDATPTPAPTSVAPAAATAVAAQGPFPATALVDRPEVEGPAPREAGSGWPFRAGWPDAAPAMVVPLVVTALLGLVLGLGDLLGVFELAALVADGVFGGGP